MQIGSETLIPFLTEFATLSRSQQRVFLFCIEFLPHPCVRSGDLQRIQLCTAVSRNTVRASLRAIASLPILSRCVSFSRINKKDTINEYWQNTLPQAD